MISTIVEMLAYPFLQRAIIVGLLVSICASLLGVSLVLKRYSMIGDGLSHVAFGAMALALVYNLNPMLLALPLLIGIAFFLLKLSENSSLKGDAVIGLVSVSSLAFGVLIISIKKGVNTDIYNYMFGSILSMSQSDVYLSLALSFLVLALYFKYYDQIFTVTFDENFARATGVNVSLYNGLIACLTAITIVLGMRMMGSMLISSLIIFPALSSMRLFGSFKSVIISSLLVSIFSFLIGIIMSYLYSLPSGATIVMVNLGIFLLFSLIGQLRK